MRILGSEKLYHLPEATELIINHTKIQSPARFSDFGSSTFSNKHKYLGTGKFSFTLQSSHTQIATSFPTRKPYNVTFLKIS